MYEGTNQEYIRRFITHYCQNIKRMVFVTSNENSSFFYMYNFGPDKDLDEWNEKVGDAEYSATDFLEMLE